MKLQDHLIVGLVGAGAAVSIPDELMSFAMKVLLGTVTGVLSMLASACIRKLWSKKNG